MNKYELALVLSPALDEEGRAAEVAKKARLRNRKGKRRFLQLHNIRSTRCCTRRNRSSYAYYGKRSALPDHP